MIFMVASAPRMSLPAGMAGRPAYRPATLVSPCSARLRLDLAFHQAEDEQGQADDGDQGGDAPVVLAEQGSDGERAFERGVAAFYCFLPLVEDQDLGGGSLVGVQVGEQGIPAVGGGLGVDRLLVEYPGEGGFAGVGIGAGLCLQVGADPPAGSDDREAGVDLAFGRDAPRRPAGLPWSR